MIDLLAKQNPEIARLGAKDVLPDRLIAEKCQRISHELPGAFQLTTDSGNEDERARRQGRKDADCARLSSEMRPPAGALRRSSLLFFHPRFSILNSQSSPEDPSSPRFALPASARSDKLQRMQPPIHPTTPELGEQMFAFNYEHSSNSR
jgi:hypothetical protein